MHRLSIPVDQVLYDKMQEELPFGLQTRFLKQLLRIVFSGDVKPVHIAVGDSADYTIVMVPRVKDAA